MEWISVKERLPEEEMGCLVAYAWNGKYHARDVTTYFKASNTGKLHWAIEFGSGQSIKVTHWMPLPDPPKEKKE